MNFNIRGVVRKNDEVFTKALAYPRFSGETLFPILGIAGSGKRDRTL